ncbi:MAG: DUF427 domain-containing protein [Hyalangium sp.]|uniref:DUF427 domain-containing protein n=1 Tax=Hyalangium sp. TaxID=2028555 RepID=UPI00389B329A
MPSQHIQPGPGQESVWDYPLPPRVEPFPGHIQIRFAGELIVDTRRALRVLETSLPPGFYIPREDIRPGVLVPSERTSFCKWKGTARYFSVVLDGREAQDAAWNYPDPIPEAAMLKDYVAFYVAPMDECLVDGEKATPQPHSYFGGWVTSRVVGPFLGEPGAENVCGCEY